jgi:hypothetical protein
MTHEFKPVPKYFYLLFEAEEEVEAGIAAAPDPPLKLAFDGILSARRACAKTRWLRTVAWYVDLKTLQTEQTNPVSSELTRGESSALKCLQV